MVVERVSLPSAESKDCARFNARINLRSPMNVIVFASRKGGSGKSTLAAHLAAQAHKPPCKVLMLDADPQGSLTLWHKLRNNGEPPLADGSNNLPAAVVQAE